MARRTWRRRLAGASSWTPITSAPSVAIVRSPLMIRRVLLARRVFQVAMFTASGAWLPRIGTAKPGSPAQPAAAMYWARAASRDPT